MSTDPQAPFSQPPPLYMSTPPPPQQQQPSAFDKLMQLEVEKQTEEMQKKRQSKKGASAATIVAIFVILGTAIAVWYFLLDGKETLNQLRKEQPENMTDKQREQIIKEQDGYTVSGPYDVSVETPFRTLKRGTYISTRNDHSSTKCPERCNGDVEYLGDDTITGVTWICTSDASYNLRKIIYSDTPTGYAAIYYPLYGGARVNIIKSYAPCKTDDNAILWQEPDTLHEALKRVGMCTLSDYIGKGIPEPSITNPMGPPATMYTAAVPLVFTVQGKLGDAWAKSCGDLEACGPTYDVVPNDEADGGKNCLGMRGKEAEGDTVAARFRTRVPIGGARLAWKYYSMTIPKEATDSVKIKDLLYTFSKYGYTGFPVGNGFENPDYLYLLAMTNQWNPVLKNRTYRQASINNYIIDTPSNVPVNQLGYSFYVNLDMLIKPGDSILIPLWPSGYTSPY